MRALTVIFCSAAIQQSTNANTFASPGDSTALEPSSNMNHPIRTPPPVPYGGVQEMNMVSVIQHNSPQRHFVPSLRLEDMALSLRFTSEMNRRLQRVALPGRYAGPALLSARRSTSLTTRHSALEQRGGQTSIGFANDSTDALPPVIPRTRQMQPLTLFHAKDARSVENRGCERWGPSVLPFLQHVTGALEIDESPTVLALAMIYMDRACSVSTPRTVSNSLKCPNLSPRTVHRLSVVALLLANKAMNGGSTEEHWQKLESLEIPLEQFIQMEAWMMGALGDQGLYVPEEQLLGWLQAWQETFSPKKRTKAWR